MAAVKSTLQKQVLEAFKPFEHFCKAMIDSYVVVDLNGKVLKCNQMFSQITGVKSRQATKAESLNDLLKFQIGTDTISVLDLIKHSHPTRIDEVTGVCGEQDNKNLILGIYPFIENHQVIGTFILIRDVTAETNLQDKYKVKSVQSIKDNLTGLYNRTYLEQYVAQNLTRTGEATDRKTDSQDDKSAIMMLDIDHFKKINDTFGHQAGDFVLAEISELMRENFRRSDMVFRYGGEEFLAVLPMTDLIGASRAGEKVREKVSDKKFIFEGTEIPVTISIGVAVLDTRKEDFKEVMGRSDAALYFSKENGRNQVSCHDGSQLQGLKNILAA